ncbi:hypothetical protein PR202_ga21248 [Eleusine coracana subsp. coracana]|uniref:Alpha-amylase n=1 Tax=Eleusine coracana subsp. coracana TaxID=191504 RepID=A0AAV5CZW9_ELECO|nr:hypothetical protein PR202_ga21248 [Eleusine coracana subsp. coracana]
MEKAQPTSVQSELVQPSKCRGGRAARRATTCDSPPVCSIVAGGPGPTAGAAATSLQRQQHAAASRPPNVLSDAAPTWPQMKHSSSLCLLVLLAALCSLVQAQVLFQGFNWESWKAQGGWYNCLKARVNDIADAGVTHVWLPPPSHSVSPQGILI